MSHFTVMVVTDSGDMETLQKALQPFHEYECTGIEDEYVVHVDKTEEVTEWLAAQVWYGQKKSDGAWDYERDEERARQNLTDPKQGTRSEYFAAAGLSADNEVAEYHGYEMRDGKWTRYTNPNAQWDWWVVGGRWSGMLRAKPGAECGKGEPGLMGSQYDAEGVDQCRVGDLDLAAMLEISRKNIEEGRREAFAKAVENQKKHPSADAAWLLGADGFERWDMLSVQMAEAIEHLRAVWKQKGAGKSFSDFIDAEKAEGCPRATTVRLGGSVGYNDMFGVKHGKTMQQAIDAAKPFGTFAVLLDGKWYERGDMGWWGCVSNKKDEAVWDAEFNKLLTSLPPEKVITIVDCHI